ncbi:MAG: LytTR family DNA-binding domain-containing protein [Bacteroidia bacterium]|nr:LytTR family DNA-binding domain-containing protein [Bacteroidia bacterium]
MEFFRNIVKHLNKPFPEQSSNFGEPKILAALSLFVALFLFVFQPFGISTIESNKFLICLGFGAMTFLGSSLYEFIVGKVLKLKGELEKWTLGKWMLNNLGIMLVISLANFLFARLVFFGYIQWELFPAMMYGTFMIGIIPISVLGAFIVWQQEKKYIGIAESMNQQPLSSSSQKAINEKHLFQIPLSNIRYIQGLQNYVSLAYINEEGLLKKKTERATLKHILDNLSDSSIIRSHRSFLVNSSYILSASGNAQGLLLSLADCDREIPVSRTYVPTFRAEIV